MLSKHCRSIIKKKNVSRPVNIYGHANDVDIANEFAVHCVLGCRNALNAINTCYQNIAAAL